MAADRGCSCRCNGARSRDGAARAAGFAGLCDRTAFAGGHPAVAREPATATDAARADNTAADTTSARGSRATRASALSDSAARASTLNDSAARASALSDSAT